MDKKVGLALGDYQHGVLRVQNATCGTAQGSVAAILGRWISEGNAATLMAIDAPLGWPKALASSLLNHGAGVPLSAAPDNLFRRATDRFVERQLGRRPLDVGADRIARTAHSALKLLGILRSQTGHSIPLAWTPTIDGVAAIEVYPAATLVAHGFRSSGYKERAQRAERVEILDSLDREATFDMPVSTIAASADALDAVVCLLAAKDFLEARAYSPEDRVVAEQEGWIWVAPLGLKHWRSSTHRACPI